MIIKEDQTLDAKGLNCPLPILKTKVLLNKMKAGEILYVEATDPHSVIDFEAYCARTDHELLLGSVCQGAPTAPRQRPRHGMALVDVGAQGDEFGMGARTIQSPHRLG